VKEVYPDERMGGGGKTEHKRPPKKKQDRKGDPVRDWGASKSPGRMEGGIEYTRSAKKEGRMAY